jgi:hypothetical protein
VARAATLVLITMLAGAARGDGLIQSGGSCQYCGGGRCWPVSCPPSASYSGGGGYSPAAQISGLAAAFSNLFAITNDVQRQQQEAEFRARQAWEAERQAEYERQRAAAEAARLRELENQRRLEEMRRKAEERHQTPVKDMMTTSGDLAPMTAGGELTPMSSSGELGSLPVDGTASGDFFDLQLARKGRPDAATIVVLDGSSLKPEKSTPAFAMTVPALDSAKALLKKQADKLIDRGKTEAERQYPVLGLFDPQNLAKKVPGFSTAKDLIDHARDLYDGYHTQTERALSVFRRCAHRTAAALGSAGGGDDGATDACWQGLSDTAEGTQDWALDTARSEVKRGISR